MDDPGGGRQHRLDEIAVALPARIWELAALFLRQTDEGISRTDASVMQRLSLGPLRITELAAAEQISQPGITLLVNRMQARGWAQRHPDPSDGRAVLVALTDAGRATLNSLERRYAEMLGAAMDELDDGELDSLLHAVRILDGLIAQLSDPAA